MLCPKCNKAISPEYGQNKCPYCGEPLSVEEGLKPPSSESYQPPPTPSSSNQPLWDNEGLFFTRLFNTWKQSTFYPGTFFRAIPTSTGIGRPLLYAIIIGFIG
ncbi:MAG: hypothetical protein QME16_06975, partial [Planctomycetota bacterium]|nr:hypothetical protein [Planctomycetota bacterium]